MIYLRTIASANEHIRGEYYEILSELDDTSNLHLQ